MIPHLPGEDLQIFTKVQVVSSSGHMDPNPMASSGSGWACTNPNHIPERMSDRMSEKMPERTPE